MKEIGITILLKRLINHGKDKSEGAVGGYWGFFW